MSSRARISILFHCVFARDIFHVAMLALVLGFASSADACSFAIGYFHQVTSLKGQVLESSIVSPLKFHRLRRMFAVSGAELEVYEYAGGKWTGGRKPVASTIANNVGEFAFTSLKDGHYSLQIKKGNREDWFDIEIIRTIPVTQKITFDISSVNTDCSGGHQAEVESMKK